MSSWILSAFVKWFSEQTSHKPLGLLKLFDRYRHMPLTGAWTRGWVTWLRDELSWRNIKTYLHFLSVVENFEIHVLPIMASQNCKVCLHFYWLMIHETVWYMYMYISTHMWVNIHVGTSIWIIYEIYIIYKGKALLEAISWIIQMVGIARPCCINEFTATSDIKRKPNGQ